MSKGLKFLFSVLIVLVGLLSTTSGFFYAKSNALEKEKQTVDKPAVDLSKIVSMPKTTEATSTDKTTLEKKDEKTTSTSTTEEVDNETAEEKTSLVTQPASTDSRPSRPADTYTIASGDTLYSVGKKFDLSWSLLAEANGITDINKIKVGQNIVIPKNNIVTFAINKAKAESLQKDSTGTKTKFRLSALDTAKADISPVFGLSPSDTFKQKSLDSASGIATILATHGDRTYEIKLSQPVTKGESGIWAIDSVKVSK